MGIIHRLRVFLASRKLFRNWLSAGIRYYLIKHGLIDGNITARFRCGGERVYVLSPWVYWPIVSAYYDDLLSGLDCGDLVYLVLNYGGFRVRLHIDSAAFLGDIVRENFLGGAYDDLVVGGRVVVDVGAFVGDSAIYFALRGARSVIAIEPHPSAYTEMLDNIKLNNLEGVIVPVNAGLASRSGKICIENIGVEDTAVTYHRPGDCPITVPAVTLSELISRFSINVNDAVLKMDCEGCEYDVILNDYEHIKMFRELIFEHHSNVNKLLKVLSRDYECNVRGNGIMHCIKK